MSKAERNTLPVRGDCYEKEKLTYKALRQNETDFRIIRAIADNHLSSLRELAAEFGLSGGPTVFDSLAAELT